MASFNRPQKRDAGKIASTNITNEIVDFLDDDLEAIGNVLDEFVPTVGASVIGVVNRASEDWTRYAAVALTGPVSVPTTTDSDPATVEFLDRPHMNGAKPASGNA